MRQHRLQRTVYREALNDVVRRPREDLNSFENSNFIVRVCSLVVDYIVLNESITQAASAEPPPSTAPMRSPPVPSTEEPTGQQQVQQQLGGAPAATDGGSSGEAPVTPARSTDVAAGAGPSAGQTSRAVSPAPPVLLSSTTTTPDAPPSSTRRASTPGVTASPSSDVRQRTSGSRTATLSSAVTNLANIVRMSVSMSSGEHSPSRGRGGAAGGQISGRVPSVPMPPLNTTGLSMRDDTTDEVQFACNAFRVLLRTCDNLLAGRAGWPRASTDHMGARRCGPCVFAELWTLMSTSSGDDGEQDDLVVIEGIPKYKLSLYVVRFRVQPMLERAGASNAD